MGIGKKGFTLVEIIVSLAIMTIVAGAVGAFVVAGNNSYMRGNKELTLQEEAQLTANQLIDLIIDVEKGISFSNLTDQKAVDMDGNVAKDVNGLDVTNASVGELRLINNDNSYMIRWQGDAGADYADANQVYLYEVTNSKDAEGKLVVGDFDAAKPALMAEHVSSFSVDLSELDKRKVVLNMTFTYQDKSYDISETIKLRNDLSSEPSSIYSWISGIRIIPEHEDLKQGQAFVFDYEITGDEEAIAQGVTWAVSYQDGSACKRTISGNGKLSVAADETIAENILTVTCTAVADPAIAATATVTVQKHMVDSLDIEPKDASVIQGDSLQYSYTMEGTEEAKNAGVTWSVARVDATGLKAGTTINGSGLLTADRYEPTGTLVLQVTCTSVADPGMSASTKVSVLPYTNIDGKYDATLIARNLTTYDFTEGSTEKIGYKALIECLPSWADYRNGYPQIEWSVVDDYANNYKITGLTDSDGRQFQAELECGNMTDTVVRVRAVIALSADIKTTREIDITIPPLKTVVNAKEPYIYSSQFVLNRNGKINCEIRNYKGEVNWRFADIPSELNNDFKVWNGIQKSYQVGFEVYDGAYDSVHQEGYLTTENTGESTEVRALSYISWDTEYRLKLQAWSPDDSTLVAETVILVPVVDILFANDQHVITVLRPTWTNRYDLHAYGFESGREKGHRAAKLAGYFQGELPLDSNTKFAEIDNMHLPFSQVQFDIGAHEENDYLIMTIYDERYPDHKRNLLLEVEKNPEWWEWKDNK